MNFIGDSNIKLYQKFLIFLTIFVLVLFLLDYFFSSSGDIWLIISVSIFFIIINFIYTKIYLIKYDKENFYISNIFKKHVISVKEFEKIEKLFYFPIFYRIKFNNKSFIFLIKTSEIFKIFFSFEKIEEKLTEEILNNINKNSSTQ